ncbi:MAG TPA: hypothetical protein VJM31_10460 [Vicinamibacterales bacterium]|nr:hypothetical protein [Vicinamibacterales bacterium]
MKAYGHQPEWRHGKLTSTSRGQLRAIDLHFHLPATLGRSRWLKGGMPIHHVKELLGHANIKTTDTYLNATRIGLQQSMKKYEEFKNGCTNVATK